jgi:hypothetical protein
MILYQPVELKFLRPETNSKVTIRDGIPSELTDSEKCNFVEVKYKGLFDDGFSFFQIEFLEV